MQAFNRSPWRCIFMLSTLIREIIWFNKNSEIEATKLPTMMEFSLPWDDDVMIKKGRVLSAILSCQNMLAKIIIKVNKRLRHSTFTKGIDRGVISTPLPTNVSMDALGITMFLQFSTRHSEENEWPTWAIFKLGTYNINNALILQCRKWYLPKISDWISLNQLHKNWFLFIAKRKNRSNVPSMFWSVWFTL